jgi:hypothetical protein
VVAGSKASQRGLQFKRCGRARPAAVLSLALLTAACGFGSPSARSTPPPHRSPSPVASHSPSPATASSYWVLATLGLRLHNAPDPAAPVVTVLRPGAQLDVSATQVVGGTRWLHVHAHSSPDIDGWVVGDPTLLTDIPMQQHEDATLGYSLLFPAAWNFRSGDKIGVFSSADASQVLTVETGAALDQLPPVPTSPGVLDHQEGPLDVYGQSPLLSYYRLTKGGWEMDLSFLWAAGRAYGFVYKAPSADAAILKVILSSVIIR